MDLDYSEPGVFKVTMIPYIDKIHEDFPGEIASGAPTPHADYLFKVRDKSDPQYRALPEEQVLAFHHAPVNSNNLAFCGSLEDEQTSSEKLLGSAHEGINIARLARSHTKK